MSETTAPKPPTAAQAEFKQTLSSDETPKNLASAEIKQPVTQEAQQLEGIAKAAQAGELDPDLAAREIAGETSQKQAFPQGEHSRDSSSKERKASIEEKAEEIQPRSKKLDEDISLAQKLTEYQIASWIASAKSLAEEIRLLKQESQQQTEIPLPDEYKAAMLQADEIEREVTPLEEQLRGGQVPDLGNTAKPRLAEGLRLRFDGAYRARQQRQKLDEAKGYVQGRRSEISTVRHDQNEGQYQRMKQTTVEFLTKIEEGMATVPDIIEKKQSTPPGPIEGTVRNLRQLRQNFNQLKRFQDSIRGNDQDSVRKSLELDDIQKRISQRIFLTEKLFLAQLGLTLDLSQKALKRVNFHLGDRTVFEGAPQFGGFADLAVVPKTDQVQALVAFEDQVSALRKIHSEVTGIPEGRNPFESVQKTYQKRQEALSKKNEDISTSYVSHMTPVFSAKTILREGYLINSAGQRVTKEQFRTNSPGGRQRVTLQSLAFSINGAELQYSRGGDITGQEHSGELGVGFVFPYSAVIEDYQFREQSSSQGGRQPYDELHVLGANYDSERLNDNDLVAKIDINKGFFIAPDPQKEHWTAFLMVPVEQGGAGKDQEWVDQHAVFYPDGMKPDQFIATARQTRVFERIRGTQGTLVPTGRFDKLASEQKTPLFKWVRSDVDGKVLFTPEEL